MSVIIKPVLIRNILLTEEEKKHYAMYADMFRPLVELCALHRATLDLTMPRHPVIMNASANLRRKVRKLYGTSVIQDRYNKLLKLQGF